MLVCFDHGVGVTNSVAIRFLSPTVVGVPELIRARAFVVRVLRNSFGPPDARSSHKVHDAASDEGIEIRVTSRRCAPQGNREASGVGEGFYVVGGRLPDGLFCRELGRSPMRCQPSILNRQPRFVSPELK